MRKVGSVLLSIIGGFIGLTVIFYAILVDFE